MLIWKVSCMIQSGQWLEVVLYHLYLKRTLYNIALRRVLPMIFSQEEFFLYHLVKKSTSYDI